MDNTHTHTCTCTHRAMSLQTWSQQIPSHTHTHTHTHQHQSTHPWLSPPPTESRRRGCRRSARADQGPCRQDRQAGRGAPNPTVSSAAPVYSRSLQPSILSLRWVAPFQYINALSPARIAQAPTLKPTDPPLNLIISSHRLLPLVQYYFGDRNLPKDKFIKEKQDKEGWFLVDDLMSFNRCVAPPRTLALPPRAGRAYPQP